MNERVLCFGRRGDQVGVLSTPAQKPDPRQPAVLMWNVGVNHRVGPFRAFVEASRHMAELGFVAFRFDASGFGDSAVRREAVGDPEREDLDVADAMDAVTRRTGVECFVLVGFCSSVDSAHRVAVADPRVVGTIQIEGYSFRTPGFRLRLLLRLLSTERWRRVRRLSKRSVLNRLLRKKELPEAGVFQRNYPVWSTYASEVAELSKRGVNMLFIYVGGDTNFNYVGQFWEMFETPETVRERIDVTYRPRADHTFYDVMERRSLIAEMGLWLASRYQVPGRPSRARSKNDVMPCA